MSQSSLFYHLQNKNSKLEVLVCEDLKEANELADVARFLKYDVLVFPDIRPAFGDDLRVYKDELHQLFSSLKSYYSSKKKPLVISPLKTLLFHLPKKELLEYTALEFGEIIHLKEFKEKMLYWGYSFVDMVQVEGEISFRGDIIDIYTPASKASSL